MKYLMKLKFFTESKKYLKTFESKDEKVLYTFKTKSKSTYVDNFFGRGYRNWYSPKDDGKIYTNDIEIRTSNYKPNPKKVGDLVLKIVDTPASWYISTLLENDRSGNIMSINGDWICINYDEIKKELIDILPDLEVTLDATTYNL